MALSRKQVARLKERKADSIRGLLLQVESLYQDIKDQGGSYAAVLQLQDAMDSMDEACGMIEAECEAILEETYDQSLDAGDPADI